MAVLRHYPAAHTDSCLADRKLEYLSSKVWADFQSQGCRSIGLSSYSWPQVLVRATPRNFVVGEQYHLRRCSEAGRHLVLRRGLRSVLRADILLVVRRNCFGEVDSPMVRRMIDLAVRMTIEKVVRSLIVCLAVGSSPEQVLLRGLRARQMQLAHMVSSSPRQV